MEIRFTQEMLTPYQMPSSLLVGFSPMHFCRAGLGEGGETVQDEVGCIKGSLFCLLLTGKQTPRLGLVAWKPKLPTFGEEITNRNSKLACIKEEVN